MALIKQKLEFINANTFNNRLIRRYGVLVLLVLVMLLPAFFGGYVIRISVQTGIYIILALGLNIILGYAGILNIGYVAFYAIGAYTYAMLASNHFNVHLPFILILPISALLGGLFGALLASLTTKLRGDYLAIVTLSFAEMVRLLINNMDWFTNGPKGISNLDVPSLVGFKFSSNNSFFYLIIAAVIIAIFVSFRLERSRSGRAWASIREEEDAAEALGIDTKKMKIIASAIGGIYAAIAGSLFASFQGFVSPESFIFMETVTIMCMVVLGGMGSIPGVFVGSVLLVYLPEILRRFSDFRMLFYGLLFVIMMNFRPQGILPSESVKREINSNKL